MHLMRCDGDITKMVVRKGFLDSRHSGSASRMEEDARLSKSSGHFFDIDRLATTGNALNDHIMRERAIYNARTASENSWAWVSTHSRDLSNHSLERDSWEKEDFSSSGLSAEDKIPNSFPASPPASPPADPERRPSQLREHLKRSNGTLRQLFRAERTTLKGLIKQEKPGVFQVAPFAGRRRAV